MIHLSEVVYLTEETIKELFKFKQLKGHQREVSISKTERGYTVREGDTYADELTFDEMLGQVVELLHPDIGKPRYRMLTAQGWQDWHDRLHRGDHL